MDRCLWSRRFRFGLPLRVGVRFGFGKPELELALPRVAEVPFSSERKRMTTVHRVPAAGGSAGLLPPLGDWSHMAFSKGAVDGLLELASQGGEQGG